MKRETIAEIAQAVLPEHDAYLVDVQVRGERSETVIQILADTDTGISIDVCAKVSREIASRIEEQDLIASKFRLEVSSPGLDKPLKVFRQYITNVGRNVRIRSASPDGDRTDEGVLKGVEGSAILLELADGSTLSIESDTIRECRHRLPW